MKDNDIEAATRGVILALPQNYEEALARLTPDTQAKIQAIEFASVIVMILWAIASELMISALSEYYKIVNNLWGTISHGFHTVAPKNILVLEAKNQ